jgi:hypothetical protein
LDQASVKQSKDKMLKYLKGKKAQFQAGNSFKKGQLKAKPGMRFDHFKFWNDGVAVVPSKTAAMSFGFYNEDGTLAPVVPVNYNVTILKDVRSLHSLSL